MLKRRMELVEAHIDGDARLKLKTFQILTKLNIEYMNVTYRDLSEDIMPINQSFRILHITVPNVIRIRT